MRDIGKAIFIGGILTLCVFFIDITIGIGDKLKQGHSWVNDQKPVIKPFHGVY